MAAEQATEVKTQETEGHEAQEPVAESTQQTGSSKSSKSNGKKKKGGKKRSPTPTGRGNGGSDYAN